MPTRMVINDTMCVFVLFLGQCASNFMKHETVTFEKARTINTFPESYRVTLNEIRSTQKD